ncbi:putative reverse transcriptase domain-containing protein [Tanacetum coccineum]
MRSSHQLCLSVPRIPHSSAVITERPSHSSSASPSRKRSRSPIIFVPISSPIPGALSPARADLLPPPKRIRSSDSATNLKDCSDKSSESFVPRETSLRDDIVVRGSDEPYSESDIDPEIQAEINEYIAYDDALRAEGIDVRVVVETPAQDDGAINGTYETLGDMGHKIVATGQQSVVMLERISKLKRDNMRLKGTTMPNTRSGVTMTREVVNKLIDRRVAEALKARDAGRNLEPLMEGRGEKEDENGDDYEGGNGGGNINRGVNGNRGNRNGGNRNKGVNGNRNGRGNGNGNDNGNDEAVFHISNCPQKYQVKYATCTLLNSALTRWNSHKRVIGIEAAYAMTWTETMKLMTEVYCLRNEIQKMEAELWNLTMKGNDLTAYIRRFQELVLLCTRMVPDEEDKVDRFIGGLPDNIQGNVIYAEPTRLQDAIRIANNLIDQKLKGYARSAENKRRFENNPRDNRRQQPAFKRQNVRGQNVARA